MAAAIPIAIGALASAATGTAVTAGVLSAAAAAFIMAGTQVLAAVVSSHLSSEQQGEAFGLQNLRANSLSSQKTIPILYGRHRVGGNDLYIGANEDSIVVLQAICEGPIEGLESMSVPNASKTVEAIFIDGQPIYEFDSTYYTRKNGTGGVPQADEYIPHTSSKIARTIMLGTESQGAVQWVVDLFPEATDRYKYVAYIAFQIKAEGVSALPRREAIVKAKIIKDIRTGTNIFSRNPVDILYDYVRNKRYGLGWGSSLIDITSWRSAAMYADTKNFMIDYGVTGPTKAQFVVDSILRYFRGTLSWWEGKLYLKYSDYPIEVPSFTVDDQTIMLDNEKGSIISVNEPDRSSKPKAVRVRYMSIAYDTFDFTLDDFNIGESEAFTQQIDLPAFQSKASANEIGTYALKRGNNNRTYTATLRADMIQLDIGDIGFLTSSELGISDQPVRVMQSNFSSDSSCTVVFMEEDSSLYDYNNSSEPSEMGEIHLFESMNAPPPVRNVLITETLYHYRRRSYNRVVVSYSPPVDGSTTPPTPFGWYSHANVYTGFDFFEPVNPNNESLIGAPFPDDPTEAKLTNPTEYYGAIESGDLIYLLDETNPDLKTKHVIGKRNGNIIRISDWSFGFSYQRFKLIKRSSLKTISGSRNQALIDPAEEGQTYYIAPVSVSTSGAVQDFGTETIYEYTVIGASQTLPPMIGNFTAGFTDQGLTFNIQPKDTDKGVDIHGYELRRGPTFETGVRIYTSTSGSGSIPDVMPPNTANSIWASSVSDNGLSAPTSFRIAGATDHPEYKPFGSKVIKTFTFPFSESSSSNISSDGNYFKCSQDNDNLYGYIISNPVAMFPVTPDRYPRFSKTIYLSLNHRVVGSESPEPGAPVGIRSSVSFVDSGIPSAFKGDTMAFFASGIGSHLVIRFDIIDTVLGSFYEISKNIEVSIYQRILRWSDMIR